MNQKERAIKELSRAKKALLDKKIERLEIMTLI